MKVSLTLSIVLHTLLLSFVFFSIPKSYNFKPVELDTKIINATVVDKKELNKVIDRYKQEEKRKQQKIVEEQKRKEQEKLAAERKKKELAEQHKKEKLKKEQELAAKKAAEQKAETERLAKHEAERVAKQQQFIKDEVERYRQEFALAIESNRILSSAFPSEATCKIRIKLLPDGSVLSISILESSGFAAYDQMSETAIYKAAPFPMPEDKEIYTKLRDVVFSFRNGAQNVGLS